MEGVQRMDGTNVRSLVCVYLDLGRSANSAKPCGFAVDIGNLTS